MPRYTYHCPRCDATVERIVSIDTRDDQLCQVVLKHDHHLVANPPSDDQAGPEDRCSTALVRGGIEDVGFTPFAWRP